MSVSRYIQFDSTYRNRNQWNNPAEFQTQISSYGERNALNAYDPVSTSAPSKRWTSNAFNTTGPTATFTGTIAAITSPPGYGASGDLHYTLSIIASSGNTVQREQNYYTHSILYDATSSKDAVRILSSRYLGTTSLGRDRFEITVERIDNSLSPGNTVEINDPTDLTNLSFPLIFIPCGSSKENDYKNCILYNETKSSGLTNFSYKTIDTYDGRTGLVTLDMSSGTSIATWDETDTFSIRETLPYRKDSINNEVAAPSNRVLSSTNSFSTPNDIYKTSYILMTSGSNAGETRRITNYIELTGDTVSGSFSTIEFPSTASDVDDFYKDVYVKILSGAADEDVRKILSYDGTTKIATVLNNFTASIVAEIQFEIHSIIVSPAFDNNLNSSSPVDSFEILKISYDNYKPFVYNGSLLTNQQMVCHEIELLHVILPQKVLDVFHGGLITIYPYVYVTISNVVNSSSGNSNSIISNNPNSIKATFVAAVDDVPNCNQSPYVKIDGDGMVQTLKFNVNDTLYFSVTMPNGETFKTVSVDTLSPFKPKNDIQISALFKIKRV